MIYKIAYGLFAGLGVLLCGYGGMNLALAVHRWDRARQPTSPNWGLDLESPLFAAGGFLLGASVGLFLIIYIGRRYAASPKRPPTRSSEKPKDEPRKGRGNRPYFVLSTLAALLFFGQSVAFGFWKEGWTIAVAVNLIAPLLAIMAVGWFVRSRRIEMRVVWAATLLICTTLIYFHLPQTYDLSSPRPKMSYVEGLFFCCGLEWGIWSFAFSTILGLIVTSKYRLTKGALMNERKTE